MHEGQRISSIRKSSTSSTEGTPGSPRTGRVVVRKVTTVITKYYEDGEEVQTEEMPGGEVVEVLGDQQISEDIMRKISGSSSPSPITRRKHSSGVPGSMTYTTSHSLSGPWTSDESLSGEPTVITRTTRTVTTDSDTDASEGVKASTVTTVTRRMVGDDVSDKEERPRSASSDASSREAFMSSLKETRSEARDAVSKVSTSQHPSTAYTTHYGATGLQYQEEYDDEPVYEYHPPSGAHMDQFMYGEQAGDYDNGNLPSRAMEPSMAESEDKLNRNQAWKTTKASSKEEGSTTSITSVTTTTSASKESDVARDAKDTLQKWGKPLGLPSPVPAPAPLQPSDNPSTHTPRRERKTSRKSKRTVAPVYLDLAYVPHAANPNYSNVDFFRRVRARYYVFSGIDPGREVLDALLQAKMEWEDKELGKFCFGHPRNFLILCSVPVFAKLILCYSRNDC